MIILRETLLLWEFCFVLFVSVFGSLLHFVYDFSGQNCIVGLFAPINESTWEHLKLLFFPSLLFGSVEYLAAGAHIANFLPAKAIGLLLGMALIIVAFYTYTGILGTNWLPADILTFLLGVAVSSQISLRLIAGGLFAKKAALGALLLIALLCACFFLFTFSPPHIGLFRDPLNNTYGCRRTERFRRFGLKRKNRWRNKKYIP